jgi:hypothetical protein
MVVHGDYFEGNVAEMVVIFAFLKNKVISGKLFSYNVFFLCE